MVKSGKCDSLAGRAADFSLFAHGRRAIDLAIPEIWGTGWGDIVDEKLISKKKKKQWAYLIMLVSIGKRLYVCVACLLYLLELMSQA